MISVNKQSEYKSSFREGLIQWLKVTLRTRSLSLFVYSMYFIIRFFMVSMTRRWSALIYFHQSEPTLSFGSTANTTQTIWLLYKWRFTMPKEVGKMDPGKEIKDYLYYQPHFSDEKERPLGYKMGKEKHLFHTLNLCDQK